MPRAHPGITSFNAGEFADVLIARSDLAKYPSACLDMVNMLPTVQGPAKRRGGTRMRANTRTDSRAWIGRFEFSRTQAYLLEFTPGHLRFYANRGQLVSGGNPVDLATPWEAPDLTNEDGGFALDLEQRGDVVYIFSATKPPQVLTRTGAVTFTLGAFVTKNGPLLDVNDSKTLRLYASARTGSVTVTASAAVFTADHVGTFLRLDAENFTISPWEPGKAFAAATVMRSDSKTYLAKNADGTRKSGTKTPIHESGIVVDGSGESTDETPVPIGIEWEYRDPGYGIGIITAYTSETEVTVAVQADTPYPGEVVGSGNATNVWQFGAWGPHNEYPAHVFFWKDRLGAAGKRQFWLSVPADYANFARDIVGEVRDDAAITRTLQTTQVIRWITPSETLIAGTEGKEFVIRKGTESEPLGPTNIDADERSAYGSRAVQPEVIGRELFFVQPTGRKIRQVLYDNTTGLFQAPDATVLAEHIAHGQVIDWAYQKEPDSVLWIVLGDGSLISATIEAEQQVLAFARHPTPGIVEAVEVIPSPDGTRDDVWLVVRRTVAGVQRRFVELMDAGDERARPQSQCYFLDCGLTYSGAATDTISGLDHLAGENVEVIVDGAAHPPRTVSPEGTITLTRAASVVHAGLHHWSGLRPMPMDAGASRGSARGKIQRIDTLGIQFLRTLGAKVGPDLENLDYIAFREGSDPLGHAPPLFTGIKVVPFPGDYERDATFWIVQDQPLPMTVCAILPELTTYESPG